MSREQKQHQPLPHTFDQVLVGIADENKPIGRTLTARPFLKWVGGKRSVLPLLLERMPREYNAYHEPFLGGGALYFSVQPERAVLSDINFHLILTFQAVRDNVDQLIENLKIHASRHDKAYYYRARLRLFKEKDPTKLASLFIYLNKTCFNGLYRVNQAGMFNVPMGDYKDPPILDEENLHATSQVLQGAKLLQLPFTQEKVIAKDFYYLDPPYHQTYDGYNGNGFGDSEHEKLAEFCHRLTKGGALFMLSNSDTPFVRKLYKGYTIEQISASRSVSCKAHQRGKENELLIRNYKYK